MHINENAKYIHALIKRILDSTDLLNDPDIQKMNAILDNAKNRDGINILQHPVKMSELAYDDLVKNYHNSDPYHKMMADRGNYNKVTHIVALRKWFNCQDVYISLSDAKRIIESLYS